MCGFNSGGIRSPNFQIQNTFSMKGNNLRGRSPKILKFWRKSVHSVDWLLEGRGLVGGNETSRGENVQHSRHHVNNKRNNKNCFRTKKKHSEIGKN